MIRLALGLILVVASIAGCSAGASDQGRLAATTGPGQPAASSDDGSVSAAEQGQHLSKAAADALEKALRATPDDLKAREQLVGYYFIAAALGRADAPTVARDRHLVWLIQHSPALQLLGTSPMGVVQPQPDASGYSNAKDAWSSQVTEQAAPRAKGNAGIFFAQTDDPRAEALLAAAEVSDPQNPTWPSALGNLYVRRAKASAAGSQPLQQMASAAVHELTKAWTISGSSTRDPRLSQLAKLAIVAGLDDKASQYATLLLNTFKLGGNESPLTVGGPIHDANMVLGQVALHKGDRARAEQSLLKAGATPGSPQLNQFGPNFSLARDLLTAGSRDVVIRYCDEVSSFWKDQRLVIWRSAIAAGQTPDFGDNLWN